MTFLPDTGINRRNFTLGLMLAMTAACNTDAQSRLPARDTFWRTWRDLYLNPEGRVVDTGNNGISHSEGQSYGLLFAYKAGDAEAFDKIAKWTQSRLSRPDMALHAWRYDPSASNPVADQNNATTATSSSPGPWAWPGSAGTAATTPRGPRRSAPRCAATA